MKILILNWRDIKHPASGGAEIVTYEVAKRWVEWGNEITWFVAGYPGCQVDEMMDGIRLHRRGNQTSVHFEAFRYYQRNWQGYFDVVIDEINTIPFFTPLYVKEKKIAYINQLAREIWFYEAPAPLNLFGYLLEPILLRFYRRTPFITISDSTKNDLSRIGVDEVHVINPGLDIKPLADIPKHEEKAFHPTVIYVGRVVPSKRVVDIIEAIYLVQKQVPDVQLWIVGSSDPAYHAKLENLINKCELDTSVHFFGKVPLEKRQLLMKQAHILVMASVREGWGLVVIEANAVGTPAVVYNVPGLVDSVQDNATGLVCRQNSPKELANQITRILIDHSLRDKLGMEALRRSHQFTWQKNAQNFLNTLNLIVNC
jgi:glycosyltransferase involved in cell wall biosynthesis